jgi:hypothetical protein
MKDTAGVTDDRTIKAINAAFAFHPYGQNKPSVYGAWVMGPTFVVKVPSADDMAFAHLSDLWVTTPASEQAKLKAVLEKETEADVSVSLDINKHTATPKCTYRTLRGAGTKFGFEVGFPLARLAKVLGVDSWKTVNNDVGVLVFGYKQDEFVGLFIGRRVGLDHEEK